jgi:hypothetical protein
MKRLILFLSLNLIIGFSHAQTLISEIAKPSLETAATKFETFKADGFAPSWGKD